MKLIKRDLLRLNNAISAIEGKPFNRKFSYFLAQHKLQLKNEISMIEEVRKMSDEFKEYDDKRAQLAKEHSDKNPDGSPKIENQQFVITLKYDTFQEELANLREEHKKVIEDREEQLKDFDDILNKETEYDGAKIDLEDIPDNIEPVVIEVLLSAGLVDEEK